jgi:lambda family phage portal protein
MDRSGSSFLASTTPKKRPVKKRRLKKRPSQNQATTQSNQSVYQLYTNNLFNGLFNGEKFSGGYGYASQYYDFVDYWELRAKSVELFTKNLYASGLIKRLVTNIINTGLSLEATPVSDLLPIDDDQANDWSEMVENLWRIWGNQKDLVDWKKQNTEGELQEAAKRTALLSGDVLCVIRQSPVTGLPITELVDGRHIQNPSDKSLTTAAENRGNKIVHGVEIDKNGRHIAFYRNVIKDKKQTSQRIPAQGPKSGRKIAWLVYGSKRLLDDVRGIPLLGMVAQSLNEIDRYRDSEQRAAVVNSMLAMFVKKSTDKPGTNPLRGGAKRRGVVEVEQPDGTSRDFNIDKWVPGMAIDELQVGEEPVSFKTERPHTGFNIFEDAIISAIAWTQEVPPEVLKLAFTSNFSSSRQANSEFKMFLDKERFWFASSYLKPRYENWLVSMTLTGRVKAPGLLESWRDPAKFDIFGAWTDSDWNGAIKPHVDPLKETNAYKIKDEQGYSTKARSTRELTGMKYSRNIKQLKKENQQLADAHQPLIDAGLMNAPGQQQAENDLTNGMTTEMFKGLIQNLISETLEEMEIVN